MHLELFESSDGTPKYTAMKRLNSIFKFFQRKKQETLIQYFMRT